jgi:hypothetical protein
METPEVLEKLRASGAIFTLQDLLDHLKHFNPELELSILYDTGYGIGGLRQENIQVKDGRLVIEVL